MSDDNIVIDEVLTRHNYFIQSNSKIRRVAIKRIITTGDLGWAQVRVKLDILIKKNASRTIKSRLRSDINWINDKMQVYQGVMLRIKEIKKMEKVLSERKATLGNIGVNLGIDVSNNKLPVSLSERDTDVLMEAIELYQDCMDLL